MKTIRGRLLLMLLVGLAVVLAAGGATVYVRARAGMLRQLDRDVEARVRALAPLASFEDDEFNFEFDDWPAALVGDGYFQFLTEDGELLRRSANLEGSSIPVREPELNQLYLEDVVLPGDKPGRAAWLAARPRIDPVDDDVQPDEISKSEEFIVMAALDRSAMDSALATLLTALLITGGALAVTITALVLVGVPWGLRPLNRLGKQLESVGGRTMSTRFDGDDAPRELRPIYRELNSMLDRVERTIARERSFADAAAHELRTPLSELRTTAEVAVRWPEEKKSLAALHEALGIGREMEHIVEALLSISRGGAGGNGTTNGVVALAPLVREAVQRSAKAIEGKHLKVTLDADSHQSLSAPRQALEIIVRNLIDNAVHYTPEGGAIRIIGANNGTLFTVENGPVRLVEADVQHLFEPFWRKDASRGDREHVGLGLAVVQRIAGAMGLQVEARLAGERLQMQVSPIH